MRLLTVSSTLVAALAGLSAGVVPAGQNVTPLPPSTRAAPYEPISDFSRPRYFGYFLGEAEVSGSPFHPDGTYPVDVAVAETPTGIVGLLNITFEPADFLAGTYTHTFSGRPTRDGLVTLKYSDRLCAAPAECTPQYTEEGHVQYSFEGEALFDRRELALVGPRILDHIPYSPDLPFDFITVQRQPSPRREKFTGFYENLQLVSMPSVIFPLPLFLFGNNQVTIENEEVVQWIDTTGTAFPLNWFLGQCFDDGRRRGWMNQQGWWYYHWVLDPDSRGVNVIVTSWDPDLVPECEAIDDVLVGDGLDLVHLKLAAIMFEL